MASDCWFGMEYLYCMWLLWQMVCDFMQYEGNVRKFRVILRSQTIPSNPGLSIDNAVFEEKPYIYLVENWVKFR